MMMKICKEVIAYRFFFSQNPKFKQFSQIFIGSCKFFNFYICVLLLCIGYMLVCVVSLFSIDLSYLVHHQFRLNEIVLIV
jgi:hypothetical protein